MPRRLLYGITGGIAAYKAPLLIREFQKRDVAVQCVLTRHALEFVTPVTLSALTGMPVHTSMFEEQDSRFMHLELPHWAEALLIAPATANCMAKCAWGVADDLLSTLMVAIKRPVLMAPAMNHDMWMDNVTQKNTALLLGRGVRIIHPESGYLSCVEEGMGRMAEVDAIVERTMLCFTESGALTGRRVLVTAGATREPIDPVRFISNRSSGKMGYALAEAFLKYGAHVTLISGPCHLIAPKEVDTVRVTTAEEMFNAVCAHAEDADVIVKAAAVADYTPAQTAGKKIKKTSDGVSLDLVRTKDILKHLGENKKHGQILIGFSAETHDHLKNAASKLAEKNLDMIVLNDVAAADSGFEVDTNRVLMIWRADRGIKPLATEYTMQEKDIDGVRIAYEALPLMSKIRVAGEIALRAARLLDAEPRMNTD